MKTTRWKVHELTVEAHYLSNADSDRLVSCQSVTWIEGKYKDDRAADGHVMRSIIKAPSLIVDGIDTQALTFEPQHLYFTDAITGEKGDFSIRLMNVLPGNKAEFLVKD